MTKSNPNAAPSELSDAQLAASFENGTLPHEDWDHRAHIRVAHYYLSTLSFADALEKMRTGLRRYLGQVGVVETATRGYHETMTQFWLRIIAAVMAGHADERTSREQPPGAGVSATEFISQNPFLLEKSIWRLFYSRRCMVSMQAKAEFVSPDITQLPEFDEGRIPRGDESNSTQQVCNPSMESPGP